MYFCILFFKATHLKEPPLPFQCSVCPKGFNHFDDFQEHTKVHEMKKKFGCAQCGRRFDDDVKLNQHMLSHQSKPFYCAKCNKHYRSHHSCARHQKLHGETTSRFNCNLCSKNFISAENLHSHLKNHNKAFKYTTGNFKIMFLKVILTCGFFLLDASCVTKALTLSCSSAVIVT